MFVRSGVLFALVLLERPGVPFHMAGERLCDAMAASVARVWSNSCWPRPAMDLLVVAGHLRARELSVFDVATPADKVLTSIGIALLAAALFADA